MSNIENQPCSNPCTSNENYSDTDRLKWAMENMHIDGVYKEFAFDVMKRAGTGDLGDIRHFIDRKMDEQVAME